MMKTTNAPRKIYVRNGITHVCFEGRTYGPQGGETGLSLDHPVTLEHLKSDGGRARVTVTQKRKGKANAAEAWRSVAVPRNVRG